MIAFGPFRYDPEARPLYRGDEEIALPTRVVAVLESFLKRPGRIVEKDDILASAWEGAFVGEDSLTQAVSQLRSALGDDPRAPTYQGAGAEDRLMVAAVDPAPAFTWAPPVPVFDLGEELMSANAAFRATYDVMADGEHFIFRRRLGSTPSELRLVLDWFEELKRRVPPGR